MKAKIQKYEMGGKDTMTHFNGETTSVQDHYNNYKTQAGPVYDMQWDNEWTREMPGGLGSSSYEAETKGSGVAFSNYTTVKAGPMSTCIWRQTLEKASERIVTWSGERQTAQTDRKLMGMSRATGLALVNPDGPDKGVDGAEQDWGPKLTTEKVVYDMHSRMRKPEARFQQYRALFNIQATVPLDFGFQSDAVVCRRWYWEWTVGGAQGNRGKLVIVVFPLAKGSVCKSAPLSGF